MGCMSCWGMEWEMLRIDGHTYVDTFWSGWAR